MTGEEIRKLVKYLWNVECEEFSQTIYQKSQDSYTKEKFNKMQSNTMYWIGSLDEAHMARLAKAVDNYEG
jgi:hypothetical protein